MKELKIVTWNIRQGGKKAKHDIITSLIAHAADMIVLTEFRDNDTGAFLVAALKKAGWPHVQLSNVAGHKNGIAILSTSTLESIPPPFVKEHGAHRWNEVYVPAYQLFLVGIHVPNVGERFDKQFFWQQIMHYTQQKQQERVMLVGDFNSVRVDENKSGDRKYSDFITALIENGWSDAWRQMNPTSVDHSWFSHKQNGFRLDYFFLSPKLISALAFCDFSHEEREKNYSDHSLLIAEFELSLR